MAKEVIDRIRKAETDLEDSSQAAKRQAAELIEKAKTDAKESRSKRLSEARDKASALVKAAQEESDHSLESARLEGAGVKKELLEKVGSKKDVAVTKVIAALTS